MTWLAFYLVLTLSSWACVWPMLRSPRERVRWSAPESAHFDVPVATFDTRGMT